MTLVTVTHVEELHGQSVWTGYGETEHGVTIHFAGDWRPMQDLANALRFDDGPVMANIEDWQIIGG